MLHKAILRPMKESTSVFALQPLQNDMNIT